MLGWEGEEQRILDSLAKQTKDWKVQYKPSRALLSALPCQSSSFTAQPDAALLCRTEFNQLRETGGSSGLDVIASAGSH